MVQSLKLRLLRLFAKVGLHVRVCGVLVDDHQLTSHALEASMW